MDWYVASTGYNKEFEAERQLQHRGYTTFLPYYEKTDKSYHKRIRLLFRNYIFVQFDETLIWQDVVRIPGITSILTNSAKPQLVQGNAIETLRAQAKACEETTKRQLIRAGCYVRIINGPMQYHEQAKKALVKWADADRATLLMEMMNRKTTVRFEVRDLELIA